MADASLQDRLRGHSKAFDGLLSLIPAKMYYGEEHEEEQWNKKKQSKAAAKAARKAKLDPDSELNRNAKEVMDERAKNKRKRKELEQEEAEEEEEEEEHYEPIPGVEAEKPGEGLKKKKKDKEDVASQAPATKSKKQRTDNRDSDASDEEAGEAEDEDPDASVEPATETNTDGTGEAAKKPKMTKSQLKMAAKKERAKVKAAAKKAKKEEARLVAATTSDGVDQADAVSTSDQPKPAGRRKGVAPGEPKSDSEDAGGRQDKRDQHKRTQRGCGQKEPQESAEKARAEAEEEGQESHPKGQGLAVEEALDRDDDASARSNLESGPLSPIFDTTTAAADPASTSTSISSTVAPSEKPRHIKLPADMDAVRARLAAKIEALRAARKADGPDGKPIRTRQELIESRRAKQAQRKAHRQELRKQARLAEREQREHALASNSPSVMSPASGLELEGPGGFAFGRVAFGDGSRLSHDLTYVLSGGKRRGPSDPKTALLKVQNQKARLQELDAEKREDITEKEAWLTARRRAEGEKIRDDEAILKKAVKRKEVAKKKSEQAWKERAHGVASAQKERQRKREDNIRKRREDKMLGKAGKKKKAAGGAKKARPGFEGSLGVGGRRK